ncbi:MAG TPA: hypothetical protein VNT33_12300, partial [Telluria sp.]|nr:hypothetical protein [Telluria sp.]
TVVLDTAGPRIDVRLAKPVLVQPSFTKTIGTLRFVTPRTYRPEDFPMLREKDALKGIVERGEYR